jgi:GGDEF domain-containing protein
MTEIKEELGSNPSTSQILIAAGSVKQAIEEHERHTRQQLDERQKSSDTLINTLRDRVTVLEQGERAIAKTAPPPATTIDPCTGLPLRTDAEAAIQRAIENPAHYFAAVFYVHRMNLTNARFGEAIGNQVILFCSQHIASRLTRGEDALFRWMGPAFVALIERHESEGSVLSEVQRVASTPLSRFFETSSRTVYLPMKLSGESFSLGTKTYAEVTDRIEKFILRASQTME